MLFYDLFRNDPKLVRVAAGQQLFAQGDAGQVMYVLIAGEAHVVRDQVVVEQLENGSIVGELALIDGSPRAASVMCDTECRFAVIDEHRFHFLLDETPYFALEVMRKLARRLRDAQEATPS